MDGDGKNMSSKIPPGMHCRLDACIESEKEFCDIAVKLTDWKPKYDILGLTFAESLLISLIRNVLPSYKGKIGGDTLLPLLTYDTNCRGNGWQLFMYHCLQYLFVQDKLLLINDKIVVAFGRKKIDMETSNQRVLQHTVTKIKYSFDKYKGF